MDFINLTEQPREAKLDRADVENLLSFFNFLRERQGKAAITQYQKPPRELLSEIYPNVTFEGAGYQIIARVKEEVSGSLAEQIGFIRSDIAHLATNIGYGSESLRVVFRADGIGVIKEDSWYEFFEHTLDLEDVRRDCDENDATIDEYLQDHFYENIEEQMDDPLFEPSGEGCELHFERGTQDEIERLMKLFILTEPNIEAHEDEDVLLYAASDGTDPYLDNNGYYYSERLDKLAQIAFTENRPVGWTFEYNDGAANRRSGYNESVESLSWEIGEILETASAREKMAARRELRMWLEKRGLNPADFDSPAETRVPV